MLFVVGFVCLLCFEASVCNHDAKMAHFCAANIIKKSQRRIFYLAEIILSVSVMLDGYLCGAFPTLFLVYSVDLF